MRHISLKNRGINTKALNDFFKLVLSLSLSDFGVGLGIFELWVTRLREFSYGFVIFGLSFEFDVWNKNVYDTYYKRHSYLKPDN